MQLSNNKILITGGGSGIGLGLTERFVRESNTVIVCGRRESVLNEVAHQYPSVITRVCDLSDAVERERLYQWISEEHSDLNVLINNAGVQQWMSVTEEDFYERAKDEIQVNVEAPIHLCALFVKLPALQTIINVTSGLAFTPFAKVPVYSATKAFFHSFTQSLRVLVKAKGSDVIEMIPPALNTDLGGKGLHDYAPPVSEFIESIFEQLTQGKQELTFGHSAATVNASADELRARFAQLNASL